ncbi:CDP-2,3-bis-(O-geranylgeranyl)-sn-glycerol synthase [Pyrofollis japonicus]|uniref:CDP-2,3-bis-(O-geranylgeranyl)-sn-glycerol synthase n=1 Tax=Pyrofollis japonicus TaxID=3060460 RepID=UPI00295B2F7F|nr:CDP-2,3-bis-(O-geranylgeranyl)-sn-glycerol synthase [Pyrofollis japonicus]BEP18105.1 CDP-2,3-bis-(O-geranylgeranyl)-sn-glycerol synthase [Pyrofollis japonicus]
MATVLSTLESILVLIPALAANGSPVLLKSKGTPIDANMRFYDRRPLLGPGKTWEGLLIGLIYGSIVAFLFSAVTCNILILFGGILSSLGALLGDILGAFIKRRLGLERGAPAPVLDQLDFYSGALLMLYARGLIVNPLIIVSLAPIVLILHRLTNIAAHKLRLKPVPW